jgi:xanthine dehydrogenase iron-sulfur cluster and FAD-binding subunit A
MHLREARFAACHCGGFPVLVHGVRRVRAAKEPGGGDPLVVHQDEATERRNLHRQLI